LVLIHTIPHLILCAPLNVNGRLPNKVQVAEIGKRFPRKGDYILAGLGTLPRFMEAILICVLACLHLPTGRYNHVAYLRPHRKTWDASQIDIKNFRRAECFVHCLSRLSPLLARRHQRISGSCANFSRAIVEGSPIAIRPHQLHKVPRPRPWPSAIEVS
jgi:hypothetical protein